MATQINIGQVSAYWAHPTDEPPVKTVIWLKGTEATGFDIYVWNGSAWVFSFGGSAVSKYVQTFEDSDLNVGGDLVVVHNLGDEKPIFQIISGQNERVIVNPVPLNQNTFSINLQGFRPLVGTWRITVI